MSQKFDPISAVPTNIITGFLGAGKTSTILHLLKTKPEQERWAVLVNEFGEIGIDGSLLESHHSEQHGVYIREVPGGCMCCTAGLPMQVALAQLLRRAKPDRLLIEPTGLGHPQEVLQTLKSENFQGVLSIGKVITVVDARQLSDRRYAEHETFQQQIAIADIIVGNKSDLYAENDSGRLKAYLKDNFVKQVPLLFTQQGAIERTLLDGKKVIEVEQSEQNLVHQSQENKLNLSEPPLPESGFIKAVNEGEGFVSIGWRFSDRYEFNRNKLFAFLSGVDAERLKATFNTDDGGFAYNLSKDAIAEVGTDYFQESRIEIIAREVNNNWEKDLLDCLNLAPIN